MDLHIFGVDDKKKRNTNKNPIVAGSAEGQKKILLAWSKLCAGSCKLLHVTMMKSELLSLFQMEKQSGVTCQSDK